MKKNIARILIILIMISVNIGCDQSTKHLAKKHLKGAGTIEVVGDYMVLRYTENRGAFLSIFSSIPSVLRIVLLLIAPAAALIATTAYVLYDSNIRGPHLASLCCLLGGGMSNVMIDRLFNNGYVVDFMNIGIGTIRSGIFNFADLSIVFGSCALFHYVFKTKKGAAA